MRRVSGMLPCILGFALIATGCSGDGSDAGGGNGGGTPSTPAAVATVEVAPTDVTLNRGETLQLQAVLKDSSGKTLQGRAVSWRSGDVSKATVSGAGLVTAIGAGQIQVFASSEGKQGKTEVLVVEPPVVEPPATVVRVVLDTVAVRLEEGDSMTLAATAYDATGNVVEGRAVRWASSNAGVALVSAGGVVTGLRPGLVTVTAKVDGAQAAGTIRVFAEYQFELVYGKAEVAAPVEIYTLDVNDPAASPLPVFPSGLVASHPAPSPDGTRIAYVVYGNLGYLNRHSMIFVADRDGSNPTPITLLEARNEAPAWSPDGTRIAFSSQPDLAGADIWVVNADGSGLVNLTADQPNSNKTSPTWSPALGDGSYRIAYALAQGGSSYVWSMKDDGSDKRQLTRDAAYYDSEPAWSPDGTAIAFVRSGNGIFGDLYVYTGGAARALMPANPLALAQFAPAWSPDGQMIAFASRHGGGDFHQVWTVWSDGTRLAQRTWDEQDHSDPAWITLPH